VAVRVAINGFGRIGRSLARAMITSNRELKLVAINSRADITRDVHLFKYDSVHGRFPGTAMINGDDIIINDHAVKITRITEPERLPWRNLGVDIVLECTGAFRDRGSNEGHLRAGAKTVIVAAPGEKLDATFVYGINHQDFDLGCHQIVSNASCTTNCLAHVAKVLHDNFGFSHGLMTTCHSYTMDQRLLDGSHSDLRRARAACLSMVPTSTGAAQAVAEVLPELTGRLDGLAVRVPTPNVSLVDLVATVQRPTSKEEVNQTFKEAQDGPLQGILAVSFEPLVSTDYNGASYSAIVDAELTNVMGGTLVKVMAWYDNEMGYSHRTLDLAVHVGRHLN
jgi:glyceraldehyde 3-phosphate dehydrogenase